MKDKAVSVVDAIDDRPAEVDELGVENDVQGLTELIETQIDNQATPFTVAVQGTWGSGKTSIMKQVQGNLVGVSGVKTAWVDTWSYAHLRDPAALPAAVMHDLARQLVTAEQAEGILPATADVDDPEDGALHVAAEHGDGRVEQHEDRESKAEAFERLTSTLMAGVSQVALPTLLATVTAATTGPLAAALAAAAPAAKKWWQSSQKVRQEAEQAISEGMRPELEALATEASESPEDVVAQVEAIRELKKAFSEAVEETGDSWVIFVDDLDRLAPQRAVEVMEAIQVFLSVEKCVFVLAIDFEVVREGVKDKYESVFSGADKSFDDTKARSFFDKLVQLPFDVPQARYAFAKYLKDMLGGREDSLEFFLSPNSLVGFSIGTNPRAAKRLVLSYKLGENIYRVQRDEALRDGSSADESSTTKAMRFAARCLETGYPDLFERFVSRDIGGSRDKGSVGGKGQMFPSDLELLLQFGESGAEGEIVPVPEVWPVSDDDKVRLAVFLKLFVQVFSGEQGEDADDEAGFRKEALRSALGLEQPFLTRTVRTAPESLTPHEKDDPALAPFLEVVTEDEGINEEVSETAMSMVAWLMGALGLRIKVQVNPRIWSVFSDREMKDSFGEIQLNNGSVAFRFLNIRKLKSAVKADPGPDDFVQRILEETEDAAREAKVRNSRIRVVEYDKYNVRIGVFGLQSQRDFDFFVKPIQNAASAARGSTVEPADPS